MLSPILRNLIPEPRALTPAEGELDLAGQAELSLSCPPELETQLILALSPGASCAGLRVTPGQAAGPAHLGVSLIANPESTEAREAYSLSVAPGGVRLRGTASGLRHGARTLGQILRAAAAMPGALALPCCRIDDHPRFGIRGLMLDISRDAVPTMSELRARIELCAELKYNHLQLYTEHTFAYAGHEQVWRDADPLTPGQVQELDAFATARGIELCPNQNSFGHMHRWLTREAYRPLAEAPAGIVHAFAPGPEPFGLCATDPRSLELLDDLYDQLLPCFSSERFNVGLDETLDLGLDRSASACAARGKHEVYLDYLLQVHRRVESRGKQMLYWADIALEYEQVLDRLPQQATPVVWGYEDGHPFEEQLRRLTEAGQRPWVCPGTSSWQGFTGRIPNAQANLEQATAAALAHGVDGYLVSDWGDYGHWQPHAVSLPGIVLGAQQAWSARPMDASLPAVLDAHVLQDPAGVCGAALVRLGEAYLELGSAAVNGVATFFHLRYIHHPLPIEHAPALTVEGTRRFEAALHLALRDLGDARPAGQGGDLLKHELRWARDASAWASRLAAARLELGLGSHAAEIPSRTAGVLDAELKEMLESYRDLWAARRRPGGLEDSCSKLLRVSEFLGGQA